MLPVLENLVAKMPNGRALEIRGRRQRPHHLGVQPSVPIYGLFIASPGDLAHYRADFVRLAQLAGGHGTL